MYVLYIINIDNIIYYVINTSKSLEYIILKLFSINLDYHFN